MKKQILSNLVALLLFIASLHAQDVINPVSATTTLNAQIGSSLANAYNGVGLELFANTESFFKFRSDPSELDIRTKKFFVGSDKTQFLSASGGTIEISSSHFHLKPEGDVFFSGSIDASGGRIGGFEISSSRIQSTNRDLILKSDGQISASALLLASSSFQINMNNLSRFGTDDFHL